MKINDELIACYVEGTVTDGERNFVRKYLSEHPQEYERVLCLMDNDTVDYLGEHLPVSDNCIPMNEMSFSDIAYSAAAFAPDQNKMFVPKSKFPASSSLDLYARLRKMNNELEDIL